jgi:phosphate:Na+ symporter
MLAGFGLIFIGIEYMQTGMAGVSWNFTAFTGPGSLWALAGIGIVMTIVMQSSTAAAATTLVALNAGSLTFEQGCAMILLGAYTESPPSVEQAVMARTTRRGA